MVRLSGVVRSSGVDTGITTRLTRRAGLRRSRPWYKLKRDAGPSPGLAGKTELFQKKVTKKGPKTGSGGMLLLGTISLFFRDFPGFPKIQVEKSRAGNGGEAGAYAPRKNH